MKTKQKKKPKVGMKKIKLSDMIRAALKLPEFRRILAWSVALSAVLTTALMFSSDFMAVCPASYLICAAGFVMSAMTMFFGAMTMIFLGLSFGTMVADVIIMNVKK